MVRNKSVLHKDSRNNIKGAGGDFAKSVWQGVKSSWYGVISLHKLAKGFGAYSWLAQYGKKGLRWSRQAALRKTYGKLPEKMQVFGPVLSAEEQNIENLKSDVYQAQREAEKEIVQIEEKHAKEIAAKNAEITLQKAQCARALKQERKTSYQRGHKDGASGGLNGVLVAGIMMLPLSQSTSLTAPADSNSLKNIELNCKAKVQNQKGELETKGWKVIGPDGEEYLTKNLECQGGLELR